MLGLKYGEEYLTRLLKRDKRGLSGDYFRFSGGVNFLTDLSL